MPILKLFGTAPEPAGRWNSADADAQWEPLRVEESRPYGFVLEGADPGMDYDVNIGDLGFEQIVGSSSLPGGKFQDRLKDGSIYWVESHYFESGRGRTVITLRQKVSGKGTWHIILSAPVYVVPTKIGEERYEAMVENIQDLCNGLLHDLIGKSKHSYERKLSMRGISYASMEVALGRIKELWSALSPLIQHISESPVKLPRRVISDGRYWGDRILPVALMAGLSGRGISPKTSQRPIHTRIARISETTETMEHSFILAFLKLLHKRVACCISAIRQHICIIEKDRIFRDVPLEGTHSLYELVDVPKLRRLNAELQEAQEISSMIANFSRKDLFAGINATFNGIGRHNFSQNGLYRSAFYLIRNYLSEAAIWFGDNKDAGDSTVKLTSRLYEHWVFLRMVDSFRSAGANLNPWKDFLRDTIRSHFTLEFDRGLSFEGAIGGGRSIRITFEPWITGKENAKRGGMSVYKDGANAAWSPDGIIELIIDKATRYAIVFDCKYRRTVKDDAWDTRKYLSIRSTASGAQIVRQLWIVHPGEACEIRPEDEALCFGESGPNCSSSETVLGVISALPAAGGNDENDVLYKFAAGTLAYLRRIEFGILT